MCIRDSIYVLHVQPLIDDALPLSLIQLSSFVSFVLPTLSSIKLKIQADALYSPLIPSLFSQGFSKLRDAVTEADKKLVFDKVVDQLYEAKVFDGQSVCTQWPEVCSKTDGQFLDGYYTDQCSLALNIGQYQTQNSDDTTSEGEEPLKVILTDTNLWYEDATITILPYFNSVS